MLELSRHPYDRIVITGNILRFLEHEPFRTDQHVNLLWISTWLGPLVRGVTKLPVSLLSWSKRSSFQAKEVYDSYGIPMDRYAISKIYDAEPNEFLADYLSEFISVRDLVIGFEMPPIFIGGLLKLGIDYVDLMHSPIRFLSDLAFYIRTNKPEFFDRISEYRLSKGTIEEEAEQFRERLSKLESLKLCDNSCLIAGQVERDVSLIKGTGFVSLEAFREKLGRLTQGFERLYFKPHPYQTKLLPSAAFVTKEMGAQTINENIYRIMYQPEVKKVLAISSSVVHEAPFFGCEGAFLSEYPFQLAEAFDPFKYQHVYLSAQSSVFWDYVIRGVKNNEACSILVRRGSLRDSLGMSWGAECLSSNRFNLVPQSVRRYWKRKRQRVLLRAREKCRSAWSSLLSHF